MAGRGRGQAGRGGRGRSGVVLGERGRAWEREVDDGDWEGFERGRPAPRLGYGDGDEHERRGGRRSRGCGVPASSAAQVSEVNPAHFAHATGRGYEDCGRRGRGRGVGTVRPAKGIFFVPISPKLWLICEFSATVIIMTIEYS